MYSSITTILKRGAWRGLLVMALALALLSSQVAYASASYNTITLYATAIPSGAWASVQWQDGLGNWHEVEGWAGRLEALDDSETQFIKWAASTDNAGQGPFRWVIYAEPGGAVLATSDSFNLPGGEGVDLALTLNTEAAVETTEAASHTTPVAGFVGDTDEAPPVVVDGLALALDCGSTACDYGAITALLPDAPADSWVGVQWQDVNGTWRNVEGWQGSLQTDDLGTQYVQWMVSAENLGEGPFRWVVMQSDGPVWGVSANFDLPAVGVNYVISMIRN